MSQQNGEKPGAVMAEPLVLVFFVDFREPDSYVGFERFRVIVAVLKDGTIVWSDDHIAGGAPYYIAHLGPHCVTETTSRLAGLMRALDGARADYLPPDAPFTRILLSLDAGGMVLSSSSLFFESNDAVITNYDGINFHDIAHEHAKGVQAPEYWRFLSVWARICDAVEDIIPTSHGKPIEKLPEEIRDRLQL